MQIVTVIFFIFSHYCDSTKLINVEALTGQQYTSSQCKQYVTFQSSYWSGIGDILEMYFVALSAAIVTNSTFIVPNDWGAASVHTKKEFKSRYSKGGYEGVLYHVLNLPAFRRWGDVANATVEKISNIPFDYIFFQPNRIQQFPCNSVISVNLYSCKTEKFRAYPGSQEEYGENCLYQHANVIHATVHPLLQQTWETSKDICRTGPLNSIGLLEDSINVVWHLRTGDICLKCDDK
jgi:hypothetical protein